jgi:hypothetical protein
MLLTIPWFLSIIGGRVDLDAQGRANYRKSPKLSPENSHALQSSGIAIAGSVRSGAWYDFYLSLSLSCSCFSLLSLG